VAFLAQSPADLPASRAIVDPPAATISPSARARTTPVDLPNRRSGTPPARRQDDTTPVRVPRSSRRLGQQRNCLVLQIDAELAELDDRRSAPANRVRRERQHERHPVLLAERLAVAQDAVVPRRRLDRQALGFQPADELANVFSQLGWSIVANAATGGALALCATI
jgi:hypothetical protein